MIDVVIWDPYGYQVDLNRPCGGSEVEREQLVVMLRKAGLDVCLFTGAVQPDAWPIDCKVLLYWREVEPAPWCRPLRELVRATDDPGCTIMPADGLTRVCVSEWQARRFETPTFVIPPALGDHVYNATMVWDHPPRWIYASAANKGLVATLRAWKDAPREGTLVVTTTGYDEPAPGECEYFGARWLGRLNPVELVNAIAQSQGMFYRNTAPETFGVTTAIARVMGLMLDIECVGHEPCGLVEAQSSRQDLREDTIMKRWLEILNR